MKWILTLYMLVPIDSCQVSENWDNLVKHWTKGTLNNSMDGVLQPKMSRGGILKIHLKKDQTVVYSNPFSCGFGTYKEGVWELDRSAHVLRLTLTSHKGYFNNPTDSTINEMILFNVIKLTKMELILESIDDNPSRIGFTLLQ